MIGTLPPTLGGVVLQNNGDGSELGAQLLLVSVGAVIIGVGLWIGYTGYQKRKGRKLIKDTPTERIRSAAAGRTEVTGTVSPIPEKLEQPLSEGDCVYAEWRVEEKQEIKYEHEDNSSRTKTDEQWIEVEKQTETVPFYIDDGTGKLLVDTTEAPYFVTEDGHSETVVVGPDEDLPHSFSSPVEQTLEEDASGMINIPIGSLATGGFARSENAYGGGHGDSGGSDIAEINELGGRGEAGGLSSGRDVEGYTQRAALRLKKSLSRGVGSDYDRVGPIETGPENNPRRYIQDVLPVGEDVYAFGEAEPRTGEATTDTDRFKLTRDPLSEKMVISAAGEEALIDTLGSKSIRLFLWSAGVTLIGAFFMYAALFNGA